MNKLVEINNSFESYQGLIQLYEKYKDELFGNIHLEICQFFAANMSAALGAILDKFTANLNSIHFDYLRPDIESILSKNDFLTYFGKQRTDNADNTTIKFKKLKPTDGKFFKTYIMKELIEEHTCDLPQMSEGVKEKIVEAICEIFVNAQIHSETEFIYTCGQFYPQNNKIEFTIVDTGVGFRENVNKRFQSNLSATKAIRWAVNDNNTTKKSISGGLGLTILREFVSVNKGKMQIISNDGFYQFDSNKEILKEFQGEFPGTIVNLQFRTDDKNNYSLKSEIDTNNIF
jgi:hypothetical protein